MRKKRGAVIGIISHKGGVGKTFLAKHLICLLGGLGYKVLGIDYDQQGDLMKWATSFEWEGEDFVRMEKYDLLYSPARLDVNDLKGRYDFIVVDGRPDYEAIVKLASVLDLLIVPVEGRLSIEGAKDILEILSVVPKKRLEVLIVRNKLARQDLDLNRREREIIRTLAEEYDVEVFLVSIVHSEAIRLAEFEGKNVWDFPGRLGIGVCISLGSIANWISREYGDKKKYYKLKKKLEVA